MFNSNWFIHEPDRALTLDSLPLVFLEAFDFDLIFLNSKTSTILAEASGLMDYKAGSVPTLVFGIIITWIDYTL